MEICSLSVFVFNFPPMNSKYGKSENKIINEYPQSIEFRSSAAVQDYVKE